MIECEIEMGAVGIITLEGRYNYGNRLQNYATAWVWRMKGFDPVCIYLRRQAGTVQKAKAAIRKMLGKIAPDPESMMSPERLDAFNRFDENMERRDYSRIAFGFAGEYQFFSVGSDQVWNPFFIAYCEDWFFLDFARREQRIALAPSIGLDSLTPKQAKRLSRGVRNFEHLSIRELRGAEIIKKCSGRDAVVICDPTLVLPPKEWRAVADDRLTPAEPYVFTYLLGGVGADAARILDEVTDHGRLPVVPLSDRQKPEEPDAGPAEFISLIDNAVHVVTDSFHAAVFSSILQTPLTIVRREGGASMFSRLESLAQTLGIEHKVHGSPDFDLSRAGDYEGAPEAIKRERRKFMDYLEGCLDAQLPGWRGGARA